MPRIGALACLEVKMIGKPYAGELHVRFDEGEQVFVARQILNGHEAGNGGDTPRIDLTNAEPVLYSTRHLFENIWNALNWTGASSRTGTTSAEQNNRNKQ